MSNETAPAADAVVKKVTEDEEKMDVGDLLGGGEFDASKAAALNEEELLAEISEEQKKDNEARRQQMAEWAADRIKEGMKHPEVQQDYDTLSKKNHLLNLKFDEYVTQFERCEEERKAISAQLTELKKRVVKKNSELARLTTYRNNFADAVAAAYGRSTTRNDSDDPTIGGERYEISKISVLHPDYHCGIEKCSRREMAKYFKEPEYKGMEDHFFESLRECAALLDMKDDVPRLPRLKAQNEAKRRAKTKEVSTASLQVAYETALCNCQLAAAGGIGDNFAGVVIAEEDSAVNEALSGVLSTSGSHIKRADVLVLVPPNSVAAGWGIETKKIEYSKYEDIVDMMKQLEDLEKTERLPRSLFILLDLSFPQESLAAVKGYCEDAVKRSDMHIYISGDMLPAKDQMDVKNDALRDQLRFLFEWYFERPEKIVLCNRESGLLFNYTPFPYLFQMAGKESEDLFEKAVKHLVDGIPFRLDSLKPKYRPVYKRPAEVTSAVKNQEPVPVKKTYVPNKKFVPRGRDSEPSTSTSTRDRTDRHCYNCKKPGHLTRSCPEPRLHRGSFRK